ncbi:MAG: histidine phosphotransferase family protein [Acetobacteraceae bacterium]
MAGIDGLRLAEMICARLCHDMSGLLGTLHTALDMLEGDHRDSDDPLAIARQNAGTLIARLRLLRAAWASNPDPLSLDRLKALVAGSPAAHRVTLDLSGLPPDTVLSPPVARVALNLILLAGESLPGGGEIIVAGTARDLFVQIQGPGARWPAGTAGCLVDEATAAAAVTNARELQMPLTALLAHGLGVRLSMLLPFGPASGPPPIRLQIPPASRRA